MCVAGVAYLRRCQILSVLPQLNIVRRSCASGYTCLHLTHCINLLAFCKPSINVPLHATCIEEATCSAGGVAVWVGALHTCISATVKRRSLLMCPAHAPLRFRCKYSALVRDYRSRLVQRGEPAFVG